MQSWSLSFILSHYCGYTSDCSSESKHIEQIVETISKTLKRESLSAAPAGSESNIHREDSSAVPNIVDASLHQKNTKANKCACPICVIIVILGLCIFIWWCVTGGLNASKWEGATSSS